MSNRIVLGWAVAVAAGLVGLAGPAHGQKSADKPEKKAGPAANPISDADLTAAVERRLRRDTLVPPDGIDVATAGGTVTLTGTVDSLAAKERAEAVAAETRGVRAVSNKLAVKPPAGRSDPDVRLAVVAALAADPAVEVYEITTAVAGGVVTLTGTVQSWAERELAGHVVKTVPGVSELRNELAVRPATTRSEAEVAADIRGRLTWDRRVDAGQVNVRVSEGKVTLTGTVGSAAERQQAYNDAWVVGVTAVDIAGLNVDRWWDRGGLRVTPTRRSDADIQRAVKNAFVYDPRVLSFNPTVTVKDGVVTLTGTVDNLAAKWAAETDAWNTAGVRRVRNHLRVRPEAVRTDADLARAVGHALSRDLFVDRYQVTATAANGYVSLTGTVDSQIERTRAAMTASRVDGVIGVRNFLTVDPPPDPPTLTVPDISPRDLNIKEDIEDEMFWSPWVEADEVYVSVRDGVATLSGFVDDWSESRAATENAYEGGARRVVNNLKVRD